MAEVVVDKLDYKGGKPKEVVFGGEYPWMVEWGDGRVVVWEAGVFDVEPGSVTAGYSGASKSASLTSSYHGREFQWTVSTD